MSWGFDNAQKLTIIVVETDAGGAEDPCEKVKTCQTSDSLLLFLPQRTAFEEKCRISDDGENSTDGHDTKKEVYDGLSIYMGLGHQIDSTLKPLVLGRWDGFVGKCTQIIQYGVFEVTLRFDKLS